MTGSEPDFRLLEAVLIQIRDELREHGKKLDGLRSGQDELHGAVSGLRGDLREWVAQSNAVKHEVVLDDRRLRKLEGG